MNEQLSSQSRAKQHFIQLTLDTAAHGGSASFPILTSSLSSLSASLLFNFLLSLSLPPSL